MLVYHDIISGDELLSDSFKIKEEDDIVLRVECKMVKKDAVKVDIGANPSTGDGEDGDDAGAEQVNDESYEVIDLVECCRLQETVFDKKGYMTYLKDYMKAVKKQLSEKNPDRVPTFEKAVGAYVKKLLENFNNYQFFTGENMDPEAMVMIFESTEDGKFSMIYWKDGLRAEKY